MPLNFKKTLLNAPGEKKYNHSIIFSLLFYNFNNRPTEEMELPNLLSVWNNHVQSKTWGHKPYFLLSAPKMYYRVLYFIIRLFYGIFLMAFFFLVLWIHFYMTNNIEILLYRPFHQERTDTFNSMSPNNYRFILSDSTVTVPKAPSTIRLG